jgi:hypothetical protein
MSYEKTFKKRQVMECVECGAQSLKISSKIKDCLYCHGSVAVVSRLILQAPKEKTVSKKDLTQFWEPTEASE